MTLIPLMAGAWRALVRSLDVILIAASCGVTIGTASYAAGSLLVWLGYPVEAGIMVGLALATVLLLVVMMILAMVSAGSDHVDPVSFERDPERDYRRVQGDDLPTVVRHDFTAGTRRAS